MSARCTKVRYGSRDAAMWAMFDMDQRPGEAVYRCWERGCNGSWHVTSRSGVARKPRTRR